MCMITKCSDVSMCMVATKYKCVAVCRCAWLLCVHVHGCYEVQMCCCVLMCMVAMKYKYVAVSPIIGVCVHASMSVLLHMCRSPSGCYLCECTDAILYTGNIW